jgi:hypothetical protein
MRYQRYAVYTDFLARIGDVEQALNYYNYAVIINSPYLIEISLNQSDILRNIGRLDENISLELPQSF